MAGKTLYIVVPCYNEEEALPRTSEVMANKLRELVRGGKVSEDSRVLLVDDGSRDSTWTMIKSMCERSPVFSGIALSRNRGHQAALLAGLMTARGRADVTISLDADLQDDVGAMDAMMDAFLDGCDIVYGARSSRDSDNFLKRATATGYYRLLRALGCDIVFNHADYRLMSARALDALSQYGESDLFLRGIVPMIGFKTATVEYERAERAEGESKYTLRKMLKLASDGVLSLSLAPARLILGAGLVMLLFALGLLAAALAGRDDARQWRLIAASVWGAGGIVTLALGVVGEYAGRAYLESKRRPRYNISDFAGLSAPDLRARSGADDAR
ncbi:MAG: glycosyltransferase family 2 protein [Oscillospiraceae bacterium]|jgi:glycosyltransferase involved in cell wall biosynthesis|nr:glycosyltransferase family 2 protein [Oscillospiraceae bacterium]